MLFTSKSRVLRPVQSIFRILLFTVVVAVGFPKAADAQSSLEKIPATGSDVAAELGLVMTKFKARFSEPVHCRLRLEIRTIGAGMTEVETRSPTPRRTTEILFSIKDVEFMKRQLGLLIGDEKDQQDASFVPVAFTLKAETFSTKHYAVNPFGIAVPGMSFYTWSPQHSTENLPLDEDIPLFIKTGPYFKGGAHQVKDILQEYVVAPGFIRLMVRFSKDPLPTKAEVRAEAERRAQLEDVLARFDELVERVQGSNKQEEAPPSEKVPAPDDDKEK